MNKFLNKVLVNLTNNFQFLLIKWIYCIRVYSYRCPTQWTKGSWRRKWVIKAVMLALLKLKISNIVNVLLSYKDGQYCYYFGVCNYFTAHSKTTVAIHTQQCCVCMEMTMTQMSYQRRKKMSTFYGDFSSNLVIGVVHIFDNITNEPIMEKERGKELYLLVYFCVVLCY